MVWVLDGEGGRWITTGGDASLNAGEGSGVGLEEAVGVSGKNDPVGVRAGADVEDGGEVPCIAGDGDACMTGAGRGGNPRGWLGGERAGDRGVEGGAGVGERASGRGASWRGGASGRIGMGGAM